MSPDQGALGKLETYLDATSKIMDEIAEGAADFNNSAETLRGRLEQFLAHHDDKTADELEAIASDLTPGGAHTDGWLVASVHNCIIGADPLLVAATMRQAWKGGKAGFQFLPNPQETSADEYEEAVHQLMSVFWDAYDDPRAVLTNKYNRDLDFYESLPERFTAYRGGCGISAEHLARGICWTTSRSIAEWFAWRLADLNGGTHPVVVSTSMRKQRVVLAFGSELEVVAQVYRWRTLKCRARRKRPPMTWTPDGPVEGD